VEGTVTEAVYLNTLQHSLIPQIQVMLCKEIQFFSRTVLDKWIGQGESTTWLPSPPQDLMLDISWGFLKTKKTKYSNHMY
jgi:hypothetical protein